MADLGYRGRLRGQDYVIGPRSPYDFARRGGRILGRTELLPPDGKPWVLEADLQGPPPEPTPAPKPKRKRSAKR